MTSTTNKPNGGESTNQWPARNTFLELLCTPKERGQSGTQQPAYRADVHLTHPRASFLAKTYAHAKRDIRHTRLFKQPYLHHFEDEKPDNRGKKSPTEIKHAQNHISYSEASSDRAQI